MKRELQRISDKATVFKESWGLCKSPLFIADAAVTVTGHTLMSQTPEMIRFVYIRTCVLFHSDMDPFSLLSIRPGAITRSLLFDLAPFKSEAGAPPFIYTAIRHGKHERVCLCIGVSLSRPVWVCMCACVWSESVKRMPGFWGQARVGRSVRKPPPPSSILLGEKWRKQDATSQVTLQRRSCCCIFRAAVLNRFNETEVRFKNNIHFIRIHCETLGTVEIAAVNMNTYLLRLQSREPWLIFHWGAWTHTLVVRESSEGTWSTSWLCWRPHTHARPCKHYLAVRGSACVCPACVFN